MFWLRITPTGIDLFKYRNEKSKTMREICLKLTKIYQNDIRDVVLISLFVFEQILVLLWCLHWWVWTTKSWLRQHRSHFSWDKSLHIYIAYCFLFATIIVKNIYLLLVKNENYNVPVIRSNNFFMNPFHISTTCLQFCLRLPPFTGKVFHDRAK